MRSPSYPFSASAVFLGVLLASPCPAGTAPADPPPSPEDLVRRLGDPTFRVREDAAVRLSRLGRESIPALRAGLNDPDLEVSRRCRRLLPLVGERDLQQRIDAFVADLAGHSTHQVPGWDRFRLLVGDHRPERELFADMLRSESRLLVVADTDPLAAGQRLSARCGDHFQRMYNPRGTPTTVLPGELAALLFVAGDPRVRVPVEPLWQLSSLLYHASVRTSLADGPKSAPFRKILLAWMERQHDPASLSLVLNVMVNLEFKEGLPVALRHLRDRQLAHGLTIVVVGKFGGKEHIPLLAPLLDDATQLNDVQIGRHRAVTQVRDVALAMMVHLSGQSVKDYGFEFLQSQPSLQFVPWYLGFGTPAKREAALARWRASAGEK